MVDRDGGQDRYAALLHGEGLLKTVFKAVKAAAGGLGLDRVFITGVSPVVLLDSRAKSWSRLKAGASPGAAPVAAGPPGPQGSRGRRWRWRFPRRRHAGQGSPADLPTHH